MMDVEVDDPDSDNAEDTITVQEPEWSELEMTKNQQHHDRAKTWAVPFIMHAKYEIQWGGGIDWTRLKMETAYFEQTDWIHLMFKFIEHREMYEVFRGSEPDCDDTVETCPREIAHN